MALGVIRGKRPSAMALLLQPVHFSSGQNSVATISSFRFLSSNACAHGAITSSLHLQPFLLSAALHNNLLQEPAEWVIEPSVEPQQRTDPG